VLWGSASTELPLGERRDRRLARVTTSRGQKGIFKTIALDHSATVAVVRSSWKLDANLVLSDDVTRRRCRDRQDLNLRGHCPMVLSYSSPVKPGILCRRRKIVTISYNPAHAGVECGSHTVFSSGFSDIFTGVSW
jgi:hypothetical protein